MRSLGADGEVTVLLVEDDPQVAQLLILLAAGRSPLFAFECAEDLVSGARLLAKGRVSVALLDLSAAGRVADALEALRSKSPGIPIVALLNPGEEPLGLEAVRQGASGYLVKGRLGAASLRGALAEAAGLAAAV